MPMILAEWMIASEIGCCLRPLGIVMDEQFYPTPITYGLKLCIGSATKALRL
jgi:hypothetical protein